MLEYFKKLSSNELTLFKKFIYSPYFNSNRNLIKLFEYLQLAYPDISEEYVSKKNLSINIFSDETINEVKLRKLISDFSMLMEKFLIQLEVDKKTTTNKISLLVSLRKRGLSKRFEMNMRDLFKIQKKEFSKNDEYYLNQSNLESEYYNYYFNTLKLKFATCLQQKSDALDYFFVFNKLHNFHEMLNNETGKENHFKKNFYNEILSYVEKNRVTISKNHPNIFIIYLVIKMNETLDDRYINELLKYLKSNEKKFPKDNLCYYYHYVRSYYISKINQGQIQYRPIAFEVINYMRQKDLFLIDNIITDMEFNSAINIALPLKEYKWLEEFIEEYKDSLHSEFAKDAYHLAKAKLHYQKKEYEKTFRHIKEIEFKDPKYYFHTKFLLGRVYFEMNNTEAIGYIIVNLKQYLREKKILNSSDQNAIKSYIKYISKLIKVNETPLSERKSAILILNKELDNEKNIVPNKNWFYEKLSEI